MPKTTKAKSRSSPVYIPTRKIPEWTRITLFTRAGGRCEFDGCSKYLLEHHVTFDEGNFAQFAHMVAFSVDGPRGFEERPDDINGVSNLMLLCPTCHKLIDDNAEKFTLETLQAYKTNHENQIIYLTGLRPEMKTTVITVRSNVGEQTVEIPFDHVLEAISPRYPQTKKGLPIDLTALSTKGKSFTDAACEAIDEHLSALFSSSGEVKDSKHLSVFAVATIPVLVYLGTKLTNKVPTEFYQRHRKTERWKWVEGGDVVQFSLTVARKGSDYSKVTLAISLSGKVDLKQLPAEIGEDHTVYEIAPSNAPIDPTLLKSKTDLEEFRQSYQQAIGQILNNHRGLTEFSLLAAVPPPVAILCGRELLPRAHPAVRVYDYEKSKGYYYQLTVNK